MDERDFIRHQVEQMRLSAERKLGVDDHARALDYVRHQVKQLRLSTELLGVDDRAEVLEYVDELEDEIASRGSVATLPRSLGS